MGRINTLLLVIIVVQTKLHVEVYQLAVKKVKQNVKEEQPQPLPPHLVRKTARDAPLAAIVVLDWSVCPAFVEILTSLSVMVMIYTMTVP
jgi:hypothetical protein